MNKEVYHKVEFYSPGTLFNETSSRDIPSWDVRKAIELAGEVKERYGAKPFGFRFKTFEKLEGAELEDFEVRPKKIKESGTVYFNGRIRTAAEILAGTDEDERILRSNVRCNEIPAIVESIDPNNWKWTHEFNEDDLLVTPDGQVIEGDARKCFKL